MPGPTGRGEDADPPLARLAGRAAGRWWGRHGPQVRRASRPARRWWATLVGYLWLFGYVWVGVLLGVGLRNLTGTSNPAVFIVALTGGLAMGIWQASDRVARHEGAEGAPLRWFGTALWIWLSLSVAVALLTR